MNFLPKSSFNQPNVYGAWLGIPEEEYRPANGITRSQIKDVLHCPQLFINPKAYDGKTQQNFDIGTMTHAYILEGKKPAEMGFAVKPEGMNLANKEGKEWKAAHEGRKIISTAIWNDIKCMGNSVKNHPVASGMFREVLGSEISVVAPYCPGFIGKARPDRIAGGIMWDIKTCTDASPRAFKADIFRYGYYLQPPWYVTLCRAVGINVDSFAFVAVEKTAPYAVAVYIVNLDSEVYLYGEKRIQEALYCLDICKKNSLYPSYNNNQPIFLTLPNYLRNEFEIQDIPFDDLPDIPEEEVPF